MKYLEQALHALPPEHSTYILAHCVPTPKHAHEYWAGVEDKLAWGYSDILERAFYHAVFHDLRPLMTPAVVRSFYKYGIFKNKVSIRLEVRALVYSVVVPLIPRVCSPYITRIFSFLSRPVLIYRISRKLSEAFTKRGVEGGAYADYRVPARKINRFNRLTTSLNGH